MTLLASAVSLYMWTEQRSDRYLLVLAIGWALGSARWAIHYPAQSIGTLHAIEAVILPFSMLFLPVACYELLPVKPWPLSTVIRAAAAFFVIFAIAAAAAGVTVAATYGVNVGALAFGAFCMWRAYRAEPLFGYLCAIGTFLVQGVFTAAVVYKLGNAVSNFVGVPLLFNGGLMVSIILIAHQRNRLRLAESEHTMQKIFDTAPTSIVITRPPGGVVERANQIALDLLGTTSGAFIGSTSLEERLVADPASRDRLYKELRAGRPVRGHEITLVREGGEPRLMSVNGDRIDLATGPRFILSYFDLTDLRRTEAELRASMEKTRHLYLRLEKVEEDERRALHRELHDQVGANLAALRLELDLIREKLARHDEASTMAHIEGAMEVTNETISMARNLMADLRPPALDDFGLLAALRSYGDSHSARMGMKIEVHGDDLVPPLNPVIESAMFRIAQEALINAAKHSHATGIKISLSEVNGLVMQSIEDDGAGFDPAVAAASTGHWGLNNMKERAGAVGASLQIDSAPGTGTRVRVEYLREIS